MRLRSELFKPKRKYEIGKSVLQCYFLFLIYIYLLAIMYIFEKNIYYQNFGYPAEYPRINIILDLPL